MEQRKPNNANRRSSKKQQQQKQSATATAGAGAVNAAATEASPQRTRKNKRQSAAGGAAAAAGGSGGGGRAVAASNNQEEVFLTEQEQQVLRRIVLDFLRTSNPEYLLSGLTNVERKFVHRFASSKGLKTRSTGSADQRVLHIIQRKPQNVLLNAFPITLSPINKQLFADFFDQVSSQLIKDSTEQEQRSPGNVERWTTRSDSAMYGNRLIPPPPNRIDVRLMHERMCLPINKQRDCVLNLLHNHSVIIISGETGSGKTTQVPQYILDDATRHNRGCRVVVTQPRRIAAISVANRVAMERGEQIGGTVGYQIRMERVVSKNTCLLYTTSGSFLRSIMSHCNEVFRNVSHLIIDEIHEREKDTDFMLITIKQQLALNKGLRVILMSATMDIRMLSNYFGVCPVIHVPGHSYDLKILYLEDILFQTGYRTDVMNKHLNSIYNSTSTMQPQAQAQANITEDSTANVAQMIQDATMSRIIDETLERCLIENDTDAMDQLEYYIECENVPVDVAHTVTGNTPLMMACKRNEPEYVIKFLQKGANIALANNSGYTACSFAALHMHYECLDILDTVAASQHLQVHENFINEQKQLLLDVYQKQFNAENEVDHNLILSLIEYLYRHDDNGAVMVFLPGYADIIQQRELIQATFEVGTYRTFILHGQMNSDDQNAALTICAERKIILSTNIGQTSITIPDLSFVIDSGRVKMKTYDSVTDSSQLQSIWISQADADQRSGRAGRTKNGVCFRLYSSDRYNDMSRFCVPEFMRIPLAEICLYAKTLQENMSVQDFIALSLNPPSPISVEKALRKLEILGVFTEKEEVTPLGKCLVELPLDVQLGKCLIYSIFLRCYESVLTMVAFLSIKDPFVLPNDRTAQGKASFLRKSFAGTSQSDQIGIISLYNAYCNVRANRKRSKDFCMKNFLSYSAMELFLATRKQIGDVITRHFRMNSLVNEYRHNYGMIRFALSAGMYPNLAHIDRRMTQIISGSESNLAIQRNSSLSPSGSKNLKDYITTLTSDWILFYEKSRLNGRTHSINMNTLITPLIVILQCGKYVDLEVESDVLWDDQVDDNVPDDEYDAELGVETGNKQTTSCAQLMAKLDRLSLSNKKYLGKSTFDTESVLSLDSWIKFQLSKIDANIILALREHQRIQFEIFLKERELNDKCKLSSLLFCEFLANENH